MENLKISLNNLQIAILNARDLCDEALEEIRRVQDKGQVDKYMNSLDKLIHELAGK